MLAPADAHTPDARDARTSSCRMYRDARCSCAAGTSDVPLSCETTLRQLLIALLTLLDYVYYIIVRFKLWLRRNALHDVANGYADVAFAILASVSLRCAAPASVKQRAARGHARSLALAISGYPRERSNRCVSVLTRQRTDIEWGLRHLQCSRAPPIVPALRLILVIRNPKMAL